MLLFSKPSKNDLLLTQITTVTQFTTLLKGDEWTEQYKKWIQTKYKNKESLSHEFSLKQLQDLKKSLDQGDPSYIQNMQELLSHKIVLQVGISQLEKIWGCTICVSKILEHINKLNEFDDELKNNFFNK
jgi:hypothetical protein